MMNKQEEIRETIARKMAESNPLYEDGDWDNGSEEYKEVWRESADGLLAYLHSQGVVIKVERDLPKEFAATITKSWIGKDEIGGSRVICNKALPAQAKSVLENAGYVAVEPLVNDENR